jgi:vacuolar-type H+-ATPase subunit I/STV1
LNESQVLKTNRELKTTTDSNNTSEREMKREKKIRKLERRLSGLSKTIRELEEKDMSLAEMEHCDLYSVEANLKKQACEVS